MKNKIVEGNKARQLLENPIFKQVVDQVRSNYQAKIESSKAGDKELREDSYYILRALRALEIEIKRIVDEGVTAEHSERVAQAERNLNILKS